MRYLVVFFAFLLSGCSNDEHRLNKLFQTESFITNYIFKTAYTCGENGVPYGECRDIVRDQVGLN